MYEQINNMIEMSLNIVLWLVVLLIIVPIFMFMVVKMSVYAFFLGRRQFYDDQEKKGKDRYGF